MRLLLRLIAILLALAPLWPTAAGRQATALALPAVRADEPVTVAGVTLEEVLVAGRPVRFDREIPVAALDNVRAALGSALADLPRLSGLPPSATPVAVYLLASQSRFRAALSELGGVRVELVDQQAGAYAIQRGETMLLFFQASEVDSSSSEALLVLAHELAHLAVREASRARPVPQWFNEGYAAWLSQRVLGERFPSEASLQRGVDRAVVASALLTRRELLPWTDLVTRARFSQAGAQGWTWLEYGQSTLFIDWLAARHGTNALAAFLLTIGDGASAGQAFQASFGSFATAATDFEAALTTLPGELGSGLRPLVTGAQVGQDVAFAIVGGLPGERAATELRIDGEVRLRGSETLDPAGFLVLWFGGPLTIAPGQLTFRFDSPSQGLLEASLLVGPGRDRRPVPAPVQVPRRLGPGWWPDRISGLR